MDRNTLDEINVLSKELSEKPEEPGGSPRAERNMITERPYSTNPDTHPVNGKHTPEDDEDDDDDEAEEEDLILGDEDAVSGDEEEFDVELEEDIDKADIDEDDLVIDTDEDVDDEDDDL